MSNNFTDRINGVLSSLAIKAPCLYATTANITLSGLGTRAGGPWASSLTAGDRILVMNQTDATKNGIYNADSSDWERASDFDGNRDVTQGTRVPVVNEAGLTGVMYEVTTANPITIGTSSIGFSNSQGDGSGQMVTATGGTRARSMADREADRVNVSDSTGVDLTGASYSTTGFIAALLRATTSAIGYSGTLTTYSQKKVFLPRGLLKCASAITADTAQALNWVTIEGDDTIIAADAGVTVFGGVGYNVKFKGIQFHGGACAVSIKTANSDANMIVFEDCAFIGQTSSQVRSDATSQSSIVKFTRCKFYTPTTSGDWKILDMQTGDEVIIEDCWMYARNDSGNAPIQMGSAKLVMRGAKGVPLTALTYWIRCGAGSLLVDSSTRFGGEIAVENIVHMYTNSVALGGSATFLRISDSHVFCTGAVVKFFGIPNQVVIENNDGFIDTDAFFIDGTVPTADLNRIGASNFEFRVGGNVQKMIAYPDYKQGNGKATQGLCYAHKAMRPSFSSPPRTADVIINSQGFTGGFGASYLGTCTQDTAVTDAYSTPAVKFTASANDQTCTRTHTTFLNGVAAGTYTLVVGVSNLVDLALKLTITISNSVEEFVIGRGDHTLCIPFYYDGTSPQTMTFDGALPNTGSVQLNRMTLYRGHHYTDNYLVTVAGETSAPASGQWYIGDRCVRVPAVGSPKAWVNTASGTPGTFTSEGNL